MPRLFLIGALSLIIGACQSTADQSDALVKSIAARRAYNDRLDNFCKGLPEVQRAYCANKVPE
jgi:hypothetical protein